MQQELLPNLFKDEYKKLVAILTKKFGLQHIEIAEDIASDTFLLASESWGLKGIPENPTAWIYTVAKNKTIDVLRRNKNFNENISPALQHSAEKSEEITLDLSEHNIKDSQLKMLFAICNTDIKEEAQIGLALRILCGFGIDEIASAFLSEKETINKRLYRAKQKLKTENVKLELPPATNLEDKLWAVLRIIYLLFNEGYYSSTADKKIRKDFCLEAMRLNLILLDNKSTNTSASNSLMALMCFHASRFEARNLNEGFIPYEKQDANLWDNELINKGHQYLFQAQQYKSINKYILEAVIAQAHTSQKDAKDKWETILACYNRLLQLEYSPMAALNRAFAISKVRTKKEGLAEAKKLKLEKSHMYFTLLSELSENKKEKIDFLEKAISLCATETEHTFLSKKLEEVK
jgi:RNA polymerase sigma-70 factor (ECF subfamily)